MKYFKIGIILFILLTFSIGFVSAEDINETSDTVETSDMDTISLDTDSSTTNGNTYTDLDDEIKKSKKSLELKNDYTYNNKTDKIKKIEISKNNFVINGNNHYIDGDNKTSGFYITNSKNLTIKNLIFKNFDEYTIYLEDSQITLDNVSFENTKGEDGGAIIAIESKFSCKNNIFKDNYANQGSSIYLYYSECNIKNSLFLNAEPVYWSMIYGDTSKITVTDSIFANTSSRYATAIYNNYITTIKRSKFYNLYANATAGAIGIKGHDEDYKTKTIIEDCEFNNVSSLKNGGAIYLDINGITTRNDEVIINHSRFNNCSSQFGGAVLELGGKLTINECNFTNNKALFDGAAVYTSNATTSIKGCSFKNNTAELQNGGAAYIDNSYCWFSYNTFIGNLASEGGAIYSYDSKLNVLYSNFTNNNEAIHSVFTRNGSYEKNNILATDKVIWDDVNYRTNVFFPGKQIIINRLPIIGNASSTYFDLREQGLVTPVKDQGFLGSCWVFGTVSALESAFLIATNITLDISENNVHSLGLRYCMYGDTDLCEGGFPINCANIFLSWLGIVSSENDSYDELGKISTTIFEENSYHILENIVIDIKNTKLIKEALTTYGALTMEMYGEAANDNTYYNSKHHSIYYNGNESSSHIVSVVGWDDNYSRNNFNIKPPKDGAWICKNSWGTEWGDNGYFYISYYDNSLRNTALIGFIINNTELYSKLYQYDIGGYIVYLDSDLKVVQYKNNYISDDNDLIAAVGTYFEKKDTNYLITIYVNNGVVYTQKGKSKHAGYNTIKLNKYIEINKDDNFSIAINSSSIPVHTDTRQIYPSNVSYIILPYEELSSKREVAVIKAYTIENNYTPNSIKQYYKASNFVFEYDIENTVISLMKDGQIIKNATVINGKADFNIILKPGKYSILIPHENKSVISLVTILNTIITDKTITIGYNVAKNIKIKYVDSEGNILKNTTVKVKFDNGKEESLNTDENGQIIYTIKKGTKIANHNLYLTNPETTEKYTVTIKIVSRITGNKNINTYYSNNAYYTLKLIGANGKAVGKNQIVKINLHKKSYKFKTDSRGIVKIKIPSTLRPGNYKITAQYAGQTVKNTVKIKQVLKTKPVIVRKTAKRFSLKAKLLNKMKGKTIRFIICGKTFKTKTRSNGIAQVTILNKLKKGKTYKVKIIYLKDTVSTYVKVI